MIIHDREKPTLIASIACDTILGYSKKVLQPRESVEEHKENKIQVIEEHDQDWNDVDKTWLCVKEILPIMEKVNTINLESRYYKYQYFHLCFLFNNLFFIIILLLKK